MTWNLDVSRVAVIGNGAGGKTTLARVIADATGLPSFEVDCLQFLPGWQHRPSERVEQELDAVIRSDRWVIDGFGPWKTIERRAERADTFVFVDHPLWVHYWWAAERQLAAARGEEREGGPSGCPLEDVTREMFRTIGRVDEELTPKLRSLVEQLKLRGTTHVIEVHSPEELDALLQKIRQE